SNQAPLCVGPSEPFRQRCLTPFRTLLDPGRSTRLRMKPQRRKADSMGTNVYVEREKSLFDRIQHVLRPALELFPLTPQLRNRGKAGPSEHLFAPLHVRLRHLEDVDDADMHLSHGSPVVIDQAQAALGPGRVDLHFLTDLPKHCFSIRMIEEVPVFGADMSAD